MAPLIGIACNAENERFDVRAGYVRGIERAGGVAVLLPGAPAWAARHAAVCDGYMLIGGDDPIMEAFGAQTEARVKTVHPDRQAHELALLDALERERPGVPVLGVCWGMQLMALRTGAAFEQWMDDRWETAAAHRDGAAHALEPAVEHGVVRAGEIASHHRQAVLERNGRCGALRVIARGGDGVVEAVDDPARAFYVGVQWHPERNGDGALGQGVFDRFVGACGAAP